MRFKISKINLLIATGVFCVCLTALAQDAPAPAVNPAGLGLPHVFSDNMVLQQGASVPVWGWGRDGDTITVHFQGQTASGVVKDGQWMVKLGGLKPGEPDSMTVTSAAVPNGATIQFKNVLVGEVWLASGQSNMEFPLKKSDKADPDIIAAANPNIRLLHVPRARMTSPTNNINARWQECTPDTVTDFSAVEYYFARDLQKALGVPVGVIESDWGGTPIEVWMEGQFLHDSPKYHSEVYSQWVVEQDRYERAMAGYIKRKAAAKAAGEEFTNAVPQRPWKPGELYDGMIAPIAGYAIKGALWYQGESNAGSEEDAWLYHSLLPDLIRDWRGVWREEGFPFLIVQLAPFRAIQPQPSESSWASVREAQLNATKLLPNVGLAVITDVGDERNIHPTRKQPVGARLALAARGIAYHQPIEYLGPGVEGGQG